MTLLPRYHYDRYQAEHGTQWEVRVQWLVFDRHDVGCMCSLGTEREAARIVAALNHFDGTKASSRYEQIPWREAQALRLADAERLAVNA